MTPSAAHTRSVARPKRCLVTGGAGFIGSHLVEILRARGHRVTVLDDLSTGRRSNLAGCLGGSEFTLIEGDAADPQTVEPLLADCDRVFHLAAVVGVGILTREPVRAALATVAAARTVLSGAAARGIPTLLTSSSEVYGSRPPPFREDQPVGQVAVGDRRCGYGTAKALAEWTALSLRGEGAWPVVVTRLFNTVGPRQSGRHGMVLPRFAAQARSGAPITVYGDGSQRRCFSHVGDVVRALHELLETAAAHGQVVNVGSDREVTVMELAAMVRERSASSSGIRHVPWDQVFPAGFSEPQRRVPDLERLRTLLGWVPDTPLEAIVDQVLGAEEVVLTD